MKLTVVNGGVYAGLSKQLAPIMFSHIEQVRTLLTASPVYHALSYVIIVADKSAGYNTTSLAYYMGYFNDRIVEYHIIEM